MVGNTGFNSFGAGGMMPGGVENLGNFAIPVGGAGIGGGGGGSPEMQYPSSNQLAVPVSGQGHYEYEEGKSRDQFQH